jgi:hypothetical protein
LARVLRCLSARFTDSQGERAQDLGLPPQQKQYLEDFTAALIKNVARKSLHLHRLFRPMRKLAAAAGANN